MSLSPLYRLCKAVCAPCDWQTTPPLTETVLLKYVLKLLPMLQEQERVMSKGENPWLMEALGLYRQWDRTGRRPPVAAWEGALARLKGKDSRAEGAHAAYWAMEAQLDPEPFCGPGGGEDCMKEVAANAHRSACNSVARPCTTHNWQKDLVTSLIREHTPQPLQPVSVEF